MNHNAESLHGKLCISKTKISCYLFLAAPQDRCARNTKNLSAKNSWSFYKISNLMLTKNKRRLISFYHLIFFFISAREATILHTLKYILYIFLFLQLNGYLVGDTIHGYQPMVYNYCYIQIHLFLSFYWNS